jgi:CBS domain-containing protein
MNNSIAENIANFLKDFQPFNALTFDELVKISIKIRVTNLDKNKTLFQINDTLHDCFYVVSSGSINLSIISDADETLLSVCRPGDIFGLRPFFAKNNYMMSAKAREESLLYAIPIESFRPLLIENPKVLDFLLESFASTANYSKESTTKATSLLNLNPNQTEIQYFQTLEYSRKPLLVSKSATIQEVAQLMTDAFLDNIIITENNLPIGLVTDKDFRTKIATGRFPILSSIDKIMETPVITVSENLSLAESQLLMLKYSASHLCVTEDGTENSEIKGIITEHDLVLAQANNPGVLIKEIKRAKNDEELKSIRNKLTELVQTSIAKNIPISHIFNISGEILFAINKRAIELAILELGTPPARFTWLSIGSQGRKEQVLSTDQDSFLIFEDVSAEKYRDVKDYFFKLAKRVTSTMNFIGFDYCPNGHVASNILWCKSLTDWIKQYNNWIHTPGESTNEISSIFFDYDLVYGELMLENALTDTLYKNSKNNFLLFDYLGNEMLKKPAALNFFKKFNIEEEGENKGKFDLKTRAIMPLVEGARLLAISQNIRGINNTYLRFKQLAIVDESNSEIYLNAADAFLVFTKIRTLDGFKNDNSGDFINIDELSKKDKEKLKNAVLTIKEVEELIKDKFQLTHFS